MVERYVITQTERDNVLKNYIKDGKVSTFPSKEKRKVIILEYVISRFDPNQSYSEKQVNEIIKSTIDDYATVRRYLIDYGFMKRNNDGSEYWVLD
ncbi:MAG: DUF2087 domain-containing protein [Eubacteriales bacterium]|nr:DUF2087 domain-containing protein [Eubacteriales bacterium]